MIRRNLAALDDGQFRRDVDEDGRLGATAINDAITELNLRRTIAKRLGDYYEGYDKILERQLPDKSENSPDNRIPVPYARKLITSVTGYMYRPGFVRYNSDNEPYFDLLQDVFWDNGEESKTARLGKLSSIFGVAYELHYVIQRNGTLHPRFCHIPTEDGLPVYSNDVEPQIVAFIHRYIEVLPNDETTGIEHIDIYYPDVIQAYTTQGVAGQFNDMTLEEEIEHGYGMVPVAVYRNNDEIAGDFEIILPLLDAYDVLMSDSMNEFDRFAWAYLILKNLNISKDDIKDIKLKRVIEVMENGGVEFLTKEIQTQYIEFMRDWIRQEIHKQTHIPDMSDEHFAGNQSGIAIRWKLTDLENMCAVKEIGFREGLRRRIDLLNAFWRTQGLSLGDTRDIDIVMHRNIPVNFVEQADIIAKLRGHVSHKTLLDQVATFVDDPQAEIDAIMAEMDPLEGAFGELQQRQEEEEEAEPVDAQE